jgi:hypothetical protein
MAWYLESTKVPNLRFKVVSLNKATMRAALQGDTGVPFERDISPSTLAQYGYKVVKVADAPATAVPAQ